MNITRFKDIEEKLTSAPQPKTIAVVMGTDATTRGAVAHALEVGVAKAIFVGARAEVEADEKLQALASSWSVIDASDADDAAAKAVALAREGKVDVMMKGMINTDNLLRAVLNKETGILRKGDVLTHITVAEIPTYHKLLMFTDVAVIPYPTDAQREAQVKYVLQLAHQMGIERPRIGLVHCTEKVDERHFPFTAHYVKLRDDAKSGVYGDCVIDGPFDVKCCCNKHAMDKKGLVSDLEGDADVLIFPDIEAGNAFYKTLTLFAGAEVAGLLCGAQVPVVLPSRGDDVTSKYNSLLVATLCGALN